ncbi:MAG: ABC transporter ATP-binding protein [Acidobacteriota bacterium]
MRVLDVKNIDSGYGETEILYDVSIRLEKEEIVGIIGPNGAGKSTLMKTIFGLITPTSGKILFQGEDITGLRPNEMVYKGLCYVPQSDNVFPSMTVLENLKMGAYVRDDDYTLSLREVYSKFPILEERRNQKAGSLSGGEQQMVAMGIALMANPQVLLLDEPSAGLAPKVVKVIFDKIREIRDSGISILMIEQNAKESLKLADRGYVLATGQKVFEDTGRGLLNNEKVGRLYLGD